MALQESTDPNAIIQVKIFSEDNANLWWCVGCTVSERIGTVKKRLITGSGRYVARLFHLGVLLDDKRTLRQCGVNENTILSTGRSASIVRGKAGGRGSPDWSPQAEHSAQSGGHTTASHRPPSASGGAAAPPAAAAAGPTRQPSPKRNVASPPSRSNSSGGHGPTTSSSSSRPSSAAGGRPTATSSSSKAGGGAAELRYTLSREEEKLILEHKVKQLEAQLAAGKAADAAGTATAGGAVASSSGATGAAGAGAAGTAGDGGVKKWPFRPFRMGIRTPALPLDVGMFAKDPTTGAIVGALLPPPPPPQGAGPRPAHAVPLMGAVGSLAPHPPPQMYAGYAAIAAPPAALVLSTQPATVAYGSTIYPDQGSLIAKPGFLGSPSQLFNSAAPLQQQAPLSGGGGSMTSV